MTETMTGSPVFEEVFQNIRKAAEANLKMQQEVYSQWASMWPGAPTPQTAVLNQMQGFRKQWVDTISTLARKHRDVVERQYQAAIESLDAALSITDASTPEEFRRRSEQLCRKTLDCMKEMTESQIREFQEAITKWTDLFAKAGT
ncbi:hypothetical protein [Bythopirellula polymerisocia]|uniref:Phasin protein n=1 Tax=Bythopirellula polymerisocia TaxID=2528003 RepID=A0A5C6D0S7_9BACT|nr:hypothetical protein [Bythopirellula polymerisocia]TWU29775.1 hypothetical protein Pla144_05540 [Bythopirellula polymerisocia]